MQRRACCDVQHRTSGSSHVIEEARRGSSFTARTKQTRHKHPTPLTDGSLTVT